MNHPALWPLLALGPMLCLGAIAPTANPAIFPFTYVAHGLKNGCLPEAYCFYDVFKRQCPGESAEVLLLELPEGKTALYGHAVVMFHFRGALYLWDHEAGAVALRVPLPAQPDARRAEVARSYLAAIARLKKYTPWAVRRPAQDGNEACAALARLLPGRQPVQFDFRTSDRKIHPAVAFVGGGVIWFYNPEQGTAFIRAGSGEGYAQLVKAALHRAFPGAEILLRPDKRLAAIDSPPRLGG